MPLDTFHPLVREWFTGRFGEPTEPQRKGWPQIAAGRHTLIAAPTGSGKTLAAFLVCLNRLWQDWLNGKLSDGVRVVYVSPLKALSNDIERNLQQPLVELRELALQRGIAPPPIRTAVRTGDTPNAARQKMLRVPPHILVTTPESLYLMLTSEKSREVLRAVDTVIVDEIHALARDKRGSHLSLTLERLVNICEQPPVRIGLSATQRPIDDIARYLVGSNAKPINIDETPTVEQRASNVRGAEVFIVDGGHSRDLDLGIEVPPSELSAVCSNEQWGEVYERLVELIHSHRSTLIFVNTRRLAERVSHHLREVLGEDAVAGHHGSLAKELRHSAEQRLKNGELKAIVATASLEMGIDVGYIDLVCQVGSPRAISTFLQRIGRSGHSLGLTPKGRLFPLTRDELIECMALIRAIKRRELDRIEIPVAPLDILAQQIVATVACDDWEEDALFELCRRAWPYRSLFRERFDEVVELLASGLTAGTKRGLHLHRDRINGRVRARRGARLAALTSGGAIPDTAEYRVVTEPEKTFVGTLDEDFAIESMAGDVFLLGNTSWRVQQIRAGEVIVRDAEGAPPSVPFWFGEGPGRTIELSAEVSRLVQQTMHDCLTEAMDVERWVEVLQDVKNGKIELVARDTREPSPFSHELLNANPYAFLDGAPLEERRTRAVSNRRSFTAEDVRDLARLDPAAIEQVRAEAWPVVRDADELHEALLTLVTLPAGDASSWQLYYDELVSHGRATTIHCGKRTFWIAAESWPLVRAVYDHVVATPLVKLPQALDTTIERTAGWIELARGRMQVCGPATAADLAAELGLEEGSVLASLEALEGEGVVLRGNFTNNDRPASGVSAIEWCDRRLLTRIHRLTLEGLRQKIKPVSPEDFMRFLLRRHRLADDSKWGGAVGVREAIAQLQGFEIPAGAWEIKVLAARCQEYDQQWLDHLFMAGEVAWGRLRSAKRDEMNTKIATAMTRSMPISLALREDLPWLLSSDRASLPPNVSSYGTEVLTALSDRGALFFQELKAATSLLQGHIEDALRELSTLGVVTCDMFAAVRAIAGQDSGRRSSRRRLASPAVATPAGRWSRFPGLLETVTSQDRIERWCHLLLRRYGVVFRDLLTRETTAPPWHELVRAFRRLELRGEIRGGRFVTGVAGEQFAEEAAIGELRTVRETGADESWFLVSAVDPLNLAGIVLAGPRVVANSMNALILKGGSCVAAKQGDRMEFIEAVPLEVESAMRRALQIGKREPNSHVRSSWLESGRKPRKSPELSSRVPSRSLRQT